MAVDWDQINVDVRDVFGPDPVDWPVYRPVIGAPFSINGIFDQAFLLVTLIDEHAAASTLNPVMGVRLADFPAPPQQNDRVYVPKVNATFVVQNVQPDSEGWAMLQLLWVSTP